MMNRLARNVIIGLMGVLMLAGLARPAMALSEAEIYLFGQNNILYYDPGQRSCGNTVVGSFDGTSSAGLSDLQAAFVDSYQDIAASLSVAYGIPWETVVAQGILESAAGTSRFATERNNFFGIGAFDSNPNNALSYATPEEGWRGYYENIRVTSTYRNHGVFSGDTITNPYAYAQAIKDAGYATDPNYVAKLSTLIAAIENRSQERGWMSSAQLAAANPEMLMHASENAAGAGSSGTVSSVSASCIVVSGNGDINSTALSFAWPDRTHAMTDPTEAYAAAIESTGVAKGIPDACAQGGYSCDVFVATVMRYSGADPNFPCCGAENQLNYLITSGLYEEIPNTGNTADLQPGDIRSKASHIEIVAQTPDGAFKIASASHCERTADYVDYYADSSFRIFRLKS